MVILQRLNLHPNISIGKSFIEVMLELSFKDWVGIHQMDQKGSTLTAHVKIWKFGEWLWGAKQ